MTMKGHSTLNSVFAPVCVEPPRGFRSQLHKKRCAYTLVSEDIRFKRIFASFSGDDASNDSVCFHPTIHVRRHGVMYSFN